MAKPKPDLTDIFTPTAGAQPAAPQAPGDNSDLDAGNIRPLGVGLRLGEVAALDIIAERYGIARNALLRLAVRRLILDFRAGKVDLTDQIETPPPPKKRLKMPK